MAVQPGDHIGKVSDYGVKETQQGKPYFEVWFDIEGQGSTPWKGYLSEKTVERTLKTLALLGLTGDLQKVADGPIGGALNIGAEYKIKVSFQLDQDKKPTKYTKVDFVNPLTGPAKFDQAMSNQAKSKLAQFSGDWLKTKQSLGVKAQTQTVAVPF